MLKIILPFKFTALFLNTIVLSNISYAQLSEQLGNTVAVSNNNIQNIKIPFTKTTHIISAEPILYVDISSPAIEADMPEKNIVRLKPRVQTGDPTKAITRDDYFIVTIVTASYISSYKLSFLTQDLKDFDTLLAFVITIDPNHAIQLNTNNKVTTEDYKRIVLRAMGNKRSIFNVNTKANGIEFWCANLYVIDDIMIFDLGVNNHTNVQYTINSVDFKLIDKYTVSSSVSQSIEMKPIYQFENDRDQTIEHKWHNYYIFKKFTYPAKKVLDIRLTENQISGRPVEIQLDYNQILQSKNLIY